MASFQISDPSGATYQIDAPDAATAMSAFGQMKGGAASAPPPDQYQQAASAKMASLKAAGVDPSYGPVESYLNGRMFGALPTVMGALTTPASMIEHGTLNPVEGYDYAKAQQNAAIDGGNADHPYLNTAASIAGGVTTGAGLANAGVTMVPQGAGVLGTAAGMAGDGAAYGAASGFLGGGDSLADRGSSALVGAGAGLLTGAALPLAGKVLSATAAPVISNIASRMDPEGAARASLARAIMESGQSPADLQLSLDNATAAGQPNFALADALGKPGQDMLSNVVRSPGQGATQAADFLENRQMGQGRSLSNILAEGLAAPNTAAQTTAALTGARRADAAVNYGAARGSAGAVDVSPAVAHIDQNLTPGVNAVVSPMADLAALPIDGKLQWIRDRLASDTSQLTDFNRVFGVKRQVDSMISVAVRQGDGATAEVLKPIQSALDDQLASASAPYANARDTYARQSGAIEAVPTGTNAAQRGRPEDTIPAYNALSPPAQSAYRSGYADPLIEGITSAAPGVNKARGLLNDATSAELGNMSVHNGPYQPGAPDAIAQRVGRENTMFETRARAMGGSKTFDNMQAEKGMGLDPMLLVDALHGSPGGLIGAAGRMGLNALTGSTPGTRAALGQLLSMRGPSADVAGAMAAPLQTLARRAALARALGGGALLTTGETTANARQSGGR